MNPHKQLLVWLVRAQIFTLFVLILMPTVIHGLDDFYGKWIYALIVILTVSLAWILRRLLDAVE